MKLLFIGFSEQNANLLSFLISQNFAGIECIYVERDLTSDLRFVLPTIPSQHNDARGLIINLGGIGMSTYHEQHKTALLAFTQHRPTLLTTRTPIDVWQEALTGFDHCLYIQSPYNKDTILPILQTLIDKGEMFNPASLEVVETLASNTAVNAPPPKPAEVERRQLLPDSILLQKPNNQAQSILEDALSRYFKEVYHAPMVKDLCKLFWQDEPFLLKTSRYEALIDPTKNLLVSSNIARIIDYLTIAKNHEEFANSITIEPLTQDIYGEYLHKLESGQAKKYALNQLIWQIYHAILPEEIATTAHNLQIKVKFMPNLVEINDLPTYTQAVMASCLSTPKTLSDLYTIFGEAPASTLNRLCLLAVLAKIVDLDSLHLVEPQATALIQESHAQQKNQGVNKAVKTGFFKRLLSKLAF